MDCVNHSGVNATAYCQNCGKALCQGCVRSTAAGHIFCEPCWRSWQSAQQPFVMPPDHGPNPVLAGLLGVIPGVGAMYNGQFVKGLAHVVIFAVLVSMAHIYDVLGLLVAGWFFYQMFDAYHTAKARRDGEPLPDPLGLNDIGSWFVAGGRQQPVNGTGPAGAYPPQGQVPNPGAGPTQYQAPYQAPYVPPGYPEPGMPPVPPPMPPPCYSRRREPVGAVILIALGVLFLLGQMDWFSGRIFSYGWPVLLIGLGVWLIVRRMQDSQENSQGDSK